MGEARGSIDVFGMTGLRGYAAVERLPDLPNNYKIVHRAPPQRPEYLTPWLRQRLDLIAEDMAKLQPWVAALAAGMAIGASLGAWHWKIS